MLVLFIIVLLIAAIVAPFMFKRVANMVTASNPTYQDENTRKLRLGAKLGFAGLTIVAALLVLASSVHFVPAGRAGLVTRFNAVTGRTVEPGPNFTLPFIESVILYDTRVQKVEFTDLDSASTEYQDVKVTGVLNYRVNPEAVSWLYQNVGSADVLEQKVLVPALSQNLKSILPTYPILEILPARGTIAQQVTEAMTATFAGYQTDDGKPVVFFSPRELADDEVRVAACEAQTAEAEDTEDAEESEDTAEAETIAADPCLAEASVFLSNVAFTAKFNEAIEAKQAELQKIELERNILAQVRIKAEQEEAKALGEANANNLLADSLSKQGNFILQFKAIEALAPNIKVLLLDAQNGLIPILSESLLSGGEDETVPAQGPVPAQ